MISYLLLFFSSFCFSMWSWNRAAAIGGNAKTETVASDFLFALAVPAFVYAITHLPQ